MSKITAYVLISQDLDLLRWNVENARSRAGVEHDFLIVNWYNQGAPETPYKAIRAWAKAEGCLYTRFTATPKRDDTAWFLENLYRGWNEGYKKSDTEWVARMGSDQFFSKDWLLHLMNARSRWGDRAIYHSWTVESDIARQSRHDVRDFGTTWDTFDVAQFDRYAAHLQHKYNSRLGLTTHECGLWYNHPARGNQLRPDGCTWLQSKALWEEFGPMEDGINEEGVTGDVAYMDRMYDAGVSGILVPPSTTFHLVQGESRDIQNNL